MMKKIMAIAIAILMTGALWVTASAEGEVEGLQENLDELQMKNYFTEEEFVRMQQEFSEFWSDDLLNRYIPARQALQKMETDSVEEEYALLMEQGKLNFADGLRASHIANYTYGDQYAKAGCFEYLFSGIEYWSVPQFYQKNTNVIFSVEGAPIGNLKEYTNFENNRLLHQPLVLKLIKDGITIKNLLLERGETKVEDIKYCSCSGEATGLYIKCPENEYFLAVYFNCWDPYDQVEPEHYEFTTVEEITQIYEQTRHESNQTYVTPEKPLYESEAEALQSEGLLEGNENGLDLLKPLTRAEAVTILMRAAGQDTSGAANGGQTFVDVPRDYWGFGAVETASSLGVVNGVGEGKFAPEETVTSTQFAAMVLRTANDDAFNWEESVNLLVNGGIITEEQAATMDFFTRGDMAKIIYEARQKGLLAG